MRRFAPVYAASAAALVGLAFATGASGRWDDVALAPASALAAVAVGVGIRAAKPAHPAFWLAIAGAELAWCAASVVTLIAPQSVAAPGDGTWTCLPGYAALTLGTFIMLRRIGSRRPETLDAVIGTTVVAILIWPLLLHGVDARRGASVVGIAFPIWDLLLAMVLLRMLFSGWAGRRALRLLAYATVVLLVSDLLAFGVFVDASGVAARTLAAGYATAYLLFGAAALPRSMRHVPLRSVFIRDDRVTPRRTLPVVASALLVVPLVFAADELTHGTRRDAVLGVIGAVVILLVVLRIARIVQESDRLRRRVEESEELFRMVFDAAGVGISVGSDGIFSRSNPALQRMLGYSGDELAHMHFQEVTYPDDRAEVAVPIPGHPYSFEKRYINKDGDVVWADVTLTAPADNRFGIAVIDDITARKQLEADLRQAQKMEAIGQLAGGVAHDFNNLLTAVSGYAALLQGDIAPGDERRPRIDAIAVAAERAAELTQKLLAFSRRQVLQLVTADIAKLVAGFEPILRRLLPENVVLDLDLQSGAYALVDRGELEQVVLNLAVNARDAMRGGGLLRIGVHVRDESVELTVADTGAGMDAATIERIFEPFFTTKGVGKGTGLGLSTVEGIVGQLGGTIGVESAPGAGSTFTVVLPLDGTKSVAADPVAPPAAAAKAAGRVLLVEDEEIVRRVTEEMLRFSGYEVTSAASAEAALTLLSLGARPDVLVSDVLMTGMDGPTLAARARELQPDLPVLFISGYSAEALGDRTSETVLTKPFSAADLAAHVELVMHRPSLAAVA